MKKLLTVFLTTAIVAAMCAGLAACKNGTTNEPIPIAEPEPVDPYLYLRDFATVNDVIFNKNCTTQAHVVSQLDNYLDRGWLARQRSCKTNIKMAEQNLIILFIPTKGV
ncbi:MAG: hypothetical protein LBH16_12325 [Treponema sp.]|nr:hypothetical protein [Treponema sp.]